MTKLDQKRVIISLTVVSIVLSIIIILFLRQNLTLKKGIVDKYLVEKTFLSLKQKNHLEESFLFKKFPIDINMKEFYFTEQSKLDYINGYIIMISDLTVCGKCLDEELEVMSTFREKAKETSLVFLGIIGVSDRKEEAEIINLHRTGALFFPCKTIDVKSLYQMFKLNRENFLDTPFYFYISHEFITLDIFKPPLMDKKEMMRWLTIITGQDLF